MTNSNDVKDQKRQIEDEIKELRTKINTHLDKLQENLMKECDSFHELWYSMHSVQRPSSHSRHQASDGLEIWQFSQIPQKD
jgi:uncharacterized coiled-coil DUF342 family protein